MIPAPVGYQCPECVNEARRAFKMGPARRARTVAGISATRLLLASIVAVFVVEIVLSRGQILSGGLVAGGDRVGHTLNEMGALNPKLVASGQWWRLFTAMFLHASLLHIAFNAYALWIFGQFVEAELGRARMLLLYFVSGFLASVTSYAFSAGAGVGASGAIVGLLGVFIAYNLRRRHSERAQANLRLALTLILINALFGAVVHSVDNWAHGGGLVAGFVAGNVIDGIGPRNLRPAIRVVGMVLLLALGVGLWLWRTHELCATLPTC
jgi:rhomboid protease GluP